MKLNRELDITFTDFLYAVVVGAAFQQLDFFNFGFDDGLLLVAFLIFVDDWILYHAQAIKIRQTSRNFAIMLIWDIVVLPTWYAMSQAGNLKSDGFIIFIFLLSFFYFMTGLWELVFRFETRILMRLKIDWVLSCILLGEGIFLSISKSILIWWIIPITIVMVIGLRIPVWKRLIFNA